MEAHDVYGLGEFKDDQLQDHTHSNGSYIWTTSVTGSSGHVVDPSANNYVDYGRHGLVTRGKRKGVNYIIHV